MRKPLPRNRCHARQRESLTPSIMCTIGSIAVIIPFLKHSPVNSRKDLRCDKLNKYNYARNLLRFSRSSLFSRSEEHRARSYPRENYLSAREEAISSDQLILSVSEIKTARSDALRRCLLRKERRPRTYIGGDEEDTRDCS